MLTRQYAAALRSPRRLSQYAEGRGEAPAPPALVPLGAASGPASDPANRAAHTAGHSPLIAGWSLSRLRRGRDLRRQLAAAHQVHVAARGRIRLADLEPQRPFVAYEALLPPTYGGDRFAVYRTETTRVAPRSLPAAAALTGNADRAPRNRLVQGIGRISPVRVSGSRACAPIPK